MTVATSPAASPPLAHTRPHPRVLKGGPSALSPEARRQIARMSRPAPYWYLFKVVQGWVTVALAVAVALHFHRSWVSALAILVIAGRQHVFAMLLHDQTHYLGWKAKWGDLLANIFVVYPLLFVSLPAYGAIHLAHHKHFFSDKDPDIHRKIGVDWTFPMSLRRLLWLFTRDALQLNLLALIKGKNSKANTLAPHRLGPSLKWMKPVYLLAVAAIVTATHTWPIFLLYWLLPLLCITQVFLHIGAICEHAYIPDGKLDDTTTIITPTWLEGLAYPHLNFPYHIYHHLYPGIPAGRLPKVHRIFIREGLVNEAHVFKSLTSYFVYLLTLQTAERAGPAVAEVA